MAYLVDVDSYNNIDASFRSFGKRLYLNSNGTLYCVFRNLNDEIELKKSHDGGQSWQNLASINISDIQEERKNLLFVGKKDKVFVAYNFREESGLSGCSILYEDNNVQDWVELGGNDFRIKDSNGCILEDKIGYITNYNYLGKVGVKGEDFDSGVFMSSSNLYDRFLHSYSKDSVLISWVVSNVLYLGIYQKNNNIKKYLSWNDSSDRIQSYFRLIKINDALYYFVAHEKDLVDSKYKVNLYKFEFDSTTLTKIATVVDTTNIGEQPILGGHYDIAKDGYGNVYIMYVKYPPNDYLFLRKFDIYTETLENEQQLTDFKVRTPQMVSSLPNSKYIYYTYTRKS